MKKLKNIETKLNESEDCLAENLLKLLHFHQMNESDLAKNLQVPYNTIHRLLTGATSDPRVSTLQQIADFFGVTLDYLLTKNSSNPLLKQPLSQSIPVLNWGALLDPNFKQHLESNPHSKRIQIAQMENIKNLKKLFAIESTKSMQPRFPAGTTFIVSMVEQPIDGDLVLVRFKDDSISLRELSSIHLIGN